MWFRVIEGVSSFWNSWGASFRGVTGVAATMVVYLISNDFMENILYASWWLELRYINLSIALPFCCFCMAPCANLGHLMRLLPSYVDILPCSRPIRLELSLSTRLVSYRTVKIGHSGVQSQFQADSTCRYPHEHVDRVWASGLIDKRLYFNKKVVFDCSEKHKAASVSEAGIMRGNL